MWHSSTLIKCALFNPIENGWEKFAGTLRPHWYDGEPTPLSVEDVLVVTSNSEKNNDDGSEIENESEHDTETDDSDNENQ